MDESGDGVLNSFRSREMGKSILVIDTPENCASCPMGNINLHDMSKGGLYCQLNKKEDILWENAKHGNPDWCPLLDLPEKMEQTTFPKGYSDGWNNGFNACIEAILEENNNGSRERGKTDAKSNIN